MSNSSAVARVSTAAPLLVTQPDQLRDLVGRLRAAPRIGVDTEAASFHRYVDRVYLLQVSSDVETAIIDPLAVPDLTAFGALLTDQSIEVVFHDADYDLRTLHRDYGFTARRVFDTRIAAQLLGEPGIGLGSLLTKYFEITLNKKYQRADWSQRPLTAEMIAYAADDTRYLTVLRDELAAQLTARGRMAWADEEFQSLETLRWSGPERDGQAFLRLKGAKALNGRSLAILKALHEWRETTARTQDAAPFRIMGNEALIAVARVAPLEASQLPGPPDLPPSLARRYRTELLEVVGTAVGTPESDWPRIQRTPRAAPDRIIEQRFERLKLVRNARAIELGLEPGVLCPNGTLQSIAERDPQDAAELAEVPGLRRWQAEAVGTPGILQAVKHG